MCEFLSSLGIAKSELRLLEGSPEGSSAIAAEDVVQILSDTGELQQGQWRLPSGDSVGFEMVSWEAQPPGPGELWRLPTDDAALTVDDRADEDQSLLSHLPVECLARVAADLSLGDLAAACAASAAFRRLARGDACWVERLRSHFGPGLLRGCYPRLAGDACCANPFARMFCHTLFGLYRARPERDSATEETSAEYLQHQRLVPDSGLTGALFQRPLLSPVFLGRPLVMDFRLPAVHPGRYDVLMRVKKLLCEPLDSEAVASAADSSGVRVPLLQARINRRNVTISNFECTIEAKASPASGGGSEEPEVVLTGMTVSHLLQNYSMPPDRWFYWRLASLTLRPEDSARDLHFRVAVMRRGVVDATVTQEEFERELRNSLLIDHLFLRLQLNQVRRRWTAETLKTD